MKLGLIILCIGLLILTYRIRKEIKIAGNLFIIVTIKNVFKQKYPLWEKLLNVFVEFKISSILLIGLLLTAIGSFVIIAEFLR